MASRSAVLVYAIVALSAGTQWCAAEERRSSYGYIPTEPSEFQTFASTPRYRGFLPEVVDLSDDFPSPGDQGTLNSCVGWAVGYAARSYYSVTAEARRRNSKDDIPSPSYIYNSIRDRANCESGSKIPDALELLRKGSLSLSQFPYSTSCRIPNQSEDADATGFRIDSWLSVNPGVVDDVKGEIARGNPVIFGLYVDQSFTELRGDRVYSQAKATDLPHSMTAVGYDDRRQAIKIINSWGTQWGQNGFGWISYEAFSKEVIEAYVMRVKSRIPVPTPRPVVVEPDLDPDVAIVEPAPIERQVAEVEVPLPVEPKPEDHVIEPTDTSTEREVQNAESEPPIAEPILEETEAAETNADLGPVSDANCTSLRQQTENGRTKISGFVGTEKALLAVQAKFPADAYSVDVDLRPWPQCEVLMTLEQALETPDAPQLSLGGKGPAMAKGDNLSIEVKTPRKPVYVYVTYIQADGSVVHLFQPGGEVMSPSKSATKLLFGDGHEGRARFTVSEPYGREMIVVVASASPLYDEPLPETQIEREFLSALRKALIYKSVPGLPNREVSAAFLGLETREN